MANLLMYVICWKDMIIGKIYELNNQFKYYPNYDNIEEATQSGLPKSLVITPQLEWGSMPKFFENRIKLDPECNDLCRSNADYLTIRKERKEYV